MSQRVIIGGSLCTVAAEHYYRTVILCLSLDAQLEMGHSIRVAVGRVGVYYVYEGNQCDKMNSHFHVSTIVDLYIFDRCSYLPSTGRVL